MHVAREHATACGILGCVTEHIPHTLICGLSVVSSFAALTSKKNKKGECGVGRIVLKWVFTVDCQWHPLLSSIANLCDLRHCIHSSMRVSTSHGT